LLCGAGVLELQLSGRAWTSESALDFEATACGVWIDAERKSILPEELRHAVPAWATSAVAVQLNPVVQARLTFHGEQVQRESPDDATMLLHFVCATPIRGRVTVRLAGNQSSAPGAVKRDDVGGGILAALQGIEAAQRAIAAAAASAAQQGEGKRPEPTVNPHIRHATDPAPAVVAEAAAPAGPGGFLGGTALADALGVHPSRRDAFFKQLERDRISLGDENWQEVSNRRANTPRYLYRADSPKLREMANAYKEPKPA
jgi:hypothetical protein